MTTEAQIVAGAYHRAWTTRDFDRAVSLLSPSLHVEVPVSSYPTRESFAEALLMFGSQVASVEVLSEMDAGDEAMILYDMEVEGLGAVRVVEHFTVSDGKIVRLRQIHDTAAIRAAASPPGDAAGYRAESRRRAAPAGLRCPDDDRGPHRLVGIHRAGIRISGRAVRTRVRRP
ncbi:MAG: nuclear transport factor 2 family protein [Trebonia sp.]